MPTKPALRSKRLTRDERAERTRQRLVDVARKLFTDKGYFETALEEIVLEADLTQGALYHHFGSKRGLFKAVFEAVEWDWKAPHVGEAATGAEVWGQYLRENAAWGDCWEVYSYGMSTTVERLPQEESGRVILYRDGPAVLGWDEWRATHRLWAVEFNAAAISQAMEEGLIGKHDPAALASMLQAVQEECAVMVAHDEGHDVERVCDEMRRLFASFRLTTAPPTRRRWARP
ncbi:MAG: TetR/AcrR family transcriptional regulator [Acidobacteria bacterium]|nr:TetR/AcrR family transcriptional regulator [Acidobacteriota bacterium]